MDTTIVPEEPLPPERFTSFEKSPHGAFLKGHAGSDTDM